MKKIITSVFLTLYIMQSYAQTHSCCSKPSASTAFASLGKDDAFVKSHLSPMPFVYETTSGNMVSVLTPDGSKANVFEVKGKSNKYVIMFHEWWGLNDYIKREAENLQKELGDVTVLAPDLYDGKIATNPDDATKYMQGLTEDRARAIVQSVINYAGQKAEIQTIGWCMGGGWSMQATLMAFKQAKGCVMYYGMPETDKNKMKSLVAPVLGIFAKKDTWINADVVEQFRNNMKDLDKKLTVELYDSDHAFANPSNPKYDKTSAADAHTKAIAFLKENFK